MTITVCSSFRHDAPYAQQFVQSLANWPASVKFRLYHHDGDVPEAVRSVTPANVEFVRLEMAAPGLIAFRQQFPIANGTMGGQQPYNYRHDAQKFAHKSFALIAEARRIIQRPSEPAGYLVWLDADTVTNKPIPPEFLPSILPAPVDIVHLGRTAINYSETSFVGFNLARPMAQEFLADLEQLYVTGELFGYAEWHDGYAFERLLKLHIGHGLSAFNLTPHCKDLDAFGVSPLASYITHYKGPTGKAIFAEPKAPAIFAEGAPTAQPTSRPIRVIPQDSRPAPEIVANIESSLKKIPTWIQKCRVHQDVLEIISGGPSAKQYLDELADRQLMQIEYESARRHRIVCVKHSHPWLLDAGIVPWMCVLLDPRPIDGISTHGQKRRELLADIHPDTIYLVASMTDPSVIEHLLDKKARIIGWHAYSNVAKSVKLPEGHFYITGGTSAAMRSIGIGHTLGFREFHMYGYDSCYPDPPANWKDIKEEGKDRPKYLPIKVGENGQTHVTSGELLAQAQDIEELLRKSDPEIELIMRGGGIGQDLFDTNPRVRLPNYADLYGRP
jgi:hypothetical protein